jgi:heme exporter protein D
MSLFAILPALPLGPAGKYVAAAYIVFLTLIVVYVAIMVKRQKRNERLLAELASELRARRQEQAEVGGHDELRSGGESEVGSLR